MNLTLPIWVVVAIAVAVAAIIALLAIKAGRREFGHFLSMFHDADGSGEWSMTRVVAFMFAIVVCLGIVRMGMQDHLHDVGWPFVALGVITLVAVPIQALFRMVEQYLRSKPGGKLLEELLKKGVSMIGIGAQQAGQGVTVQTNVTTEPQDTQHTE
jgi:hypothetical protein